MCFGNFGEPPPFLFEECFKRKLTIMTIGALPNEIC